MEYALESAASETRNAQASFDLAAKEMKEMRREIDSEIEVK